MVTPHWAREFVNFLIKREERRGRKYKKKKKKNKGKGN